MKLFAAIFLFSLSNILFAGRYYDATTGRFLQVDPKAEKYPSVSPYNYVFNNPLKNIDPDEKEPITIAGATISSGALYIGGAVIIAAVAHSYNMATNPSYRRSALSFGKVVANAGNEALSDVKEFVGKMFSSDESESKENTKIGPYEEDVNVVDKDGNVIPLKKGQTLEGDPDGSFVQVKDRDGKQTGTRKDGKGHPKQKDPKAKAPHGHRVDEN